MKRRHRRQSADPPTEVVLPITPMLDMSFQLLSFFVITFNPPSAVEGQLSLYLPAAGIAKAAAPEQIDPFAPSENELEKLADVTVAVESRGGAVGKITIREKEGSKEVGDTKELKAELEKIRELTGPANIKIEAASKLKYAVLVEVMDACLQAGFKSVGFAPPPDLNVGP